MVIFVMVIGEHFLVFLLVFLLFLFKMERIVAPILIKSTQDIFYKDSHNNALSCSETNILMIALEN